MGWSNSQVFIVQVSLFKIELLGFTREVLLIKGHLSKRLIINWSLTNCLIVLTPSYR